jgi:uncharacterized membrane protein
MTLFVRLYMPLLWVTCIPVLAYIIDTYKDKNLSIFVYLFLSIPFLLTIYGALKHLKDHRNKNNDKKVQTHKLRRANDN